MQSSVGAIDEGPGESGTSDAQIKPSLGRNHGDQCGITALPVNVSQQLQAQPDDGSQEPQGLFRLVRIDNPAANLRFARALDEAFSFIVRSTFAAGRRHPADLAGALLWQTA